MTTLTEDLAADKLQRMTNDELLAHLIERLPAIRTALDGRDVSPSNDLRICRAALHWLLGHYEAGKPELHDRVIARIEAVQKWQHPEVADMELLRSMYPEGAYQHIALRTPPQQQPSSERGLALNFARFYRSSIDAVYEEYDTIEAAYDAFIASRQEKKE